MFQTRVRLVTTTPAPPGLVSPVSLEHFNQSGVRPAAGPAPPTPPPTPPAAPPPPSASTRPVSTTPDQASPSSSLPTTPPPCPGSPSVSGGWSQVRECQWWCWCPVSPCHLTALTLSASGEEQTLSSHHVRPPRVLSSSHHRSVSTNDHV